MRVRLRKSFQYGASATHSLLSRADQEHSGGDHAEAIRTLHFAADHTTLPYAAKVMRLTASRIQGERHKEARRSIDHLHGWLQKQHGWKPSDIG